MIEHTATRRKIHVPGPGLGLSNEKQLREHIVANLGAMEQGLHIIGDDPHYVEFSCGLGYSRRACSIDILAADSNGAFVVIECKLKPATPSALGQLLGYIAWVHRQFDGLERPVRGIIVTSELTPLLTLAIKLVPHVPIMVFECRDRSHLRRVL